MILLRSSQSSQEFPFSGLSIMSSNYPQIREEKLKLRKVKSNCWRMAGASSE